MNPTVTVITSSIGRPELRRCVESVQYQTMKCRHYVYVNGLKWHIPAHEVLRDFPLVHGMFLPEETGNSGMGPSCASVFAAAPYLTESDYVFYLNDDDFYEEDHVESLVSLMEKENLSWAYSLRRFVDRHGTPVCEDDWDSLGHWPNVFGDGSFLVDNSCYALRTSVARKHSAAWMKRPYIADRIFLQELKSSNLSYGCSGKSTVNYRLGTGTAQSPEALYIECARRARQKFPEGFPWRGAPTIFRPEQTT